MNLGPLFPPELEREIFETMALMHPRNAPTLLRVARRVLIWIEPLLYRIVHLGGGRRSMTDAILHASKSKPPEFFHNAVRYLCIDSNTPVDEATQVLKLCAGIVDFSTTRGLSKPEFLPILAEMRVQRFGGCLTNFFEGYDRVNLTHPLFASLTHLDIFDVMSEGLAGICAQIPTLPKLTHLALDRNARLDTVEALLPECPRLKLLLLLWSRSDKHEYELAQVPHVYDVRLVMGMYDESWADWEAGAKGLPHLWSMGDEFVARKRTGAIEATCYWLDQQND